MGKLFGRVNYIILFGRSILKVAVYTNESMKFVRLSVCFVIKVPHRKKSTGKASYASVLVSLFGHPLPSSGNYFLDSGNKDVLLDLRNIFLPK